MTKLDYRFTNDALFKILFVKNPHLLKRLVAQLMGIQAESIGVFRITNPEIPAEVVAGKFCRLDINMEVDGQRVDLELQVSDEVNFPERALYYWSREFSSSLEEGMNYDALPRTIIISILAFNLFCCPDFHSEYRILENTRHTPLTDKFSLDFFELPKLPAGVSAQDELKLWLALFNAKTEEDLQEIERLEVSVMQETINEFRRVTGTDEFKEIERIRSRARHDEANALGHARSEGYREAEDKWQMVVADKDAALADKDAALANKDAALADSLATIADKEAALADKDAALADKDAIIAELRAQLKAR
jgi:predicted transposase/invertase (TIGR01784 family)